MGRNYLQKAYLIKNLSKIYKEFKLSDKEMKNATKKKKEMGHRLGKHSNKEDTQKISILKDASVICYW